MIDPAATPFGEGVGGNPFASFGGDTQWSFEEPTVVSGTEEKSASDYFEEHLRTIKMDHFKKVTEEVGHYLLDFASGVVKTVLESVKVIFTQAVKMALFKFAIETCAMGIKTLVETMSGMNLTPPNIDTKGVYYNFSSSAAGASVANASSQSQTNSYNNRGYENPFSNPFGSASW